MRYLLQGERITQGISYADVADVCLKALHDRAARNKTFEVRARAPLPLLLSESPLGGLALHQCAHQGCLS